MTSFTAHRPARTVRSARRCRCGRLRARCADREHQRAADRMPVGRAHAPAQHMGAGSEVRQPGDGDGRILRNDRARGEGHAGRADQTHDQRRYRLVEGQGQRRRRRGEDRAVRRLRFHQRGMRPRIGRMHERDQQRDNVRDADHGRIIFSATASAPAQARANRGPISRRLGSRSSDARLSRIPAPPESRASCRLRDRRRESR